jgi:hypothetical protein
MSLPRSLSFVSVLLRRAALPAIVAGALALVPRLAVADGTASGTVATENATATATTSSDRASGRAGVRASGTQTARVDAADGAVTAAVTPAPGRGLPTASGRARGAHVRGTATRSAPTWTDHVRVQAEGFGASASTQGGQFSRSISRVHIGAGHGSSHVWRGSALEGSTATLHGAGTVEAEHGAATSASAEGAGDLTAHVGVEMDGVHSRATGAGIAELHAAERVARASVLLRGGRGTARAGDRGFGATHSSSFQIRPAHR